MSHSQTDRDELFGVIATQLDFISREQLTIALKESKTETSNTLEESLVQQGALTHELGQLLNRLVEAHLNHHENDPAKSLATIGLSRSLRQQRPEVGDTEIDATLSLVSEDARPDEDMPSDEDVHPGVNDSDLPRFAKAIKHRFPIVRAHAKGGLGEVFVAQDVELGREVALKEIQERYAGNPNSRARFVLEAEITGGLEHPGIVPVYGFGVYEDGRPYYAMRFIRGDSFKQAITKFHSANNQPSPERHDFLGLEFRQLIDRFLDVCNAMEYAHSRGVLHRDLKPDNVMLGNYGETLVVDWGLAKATGKDDIDAKSEESPLQPASGSGSAATQHGSAMGTPAYMSPEQSIGQIEELGPATDIYSLGATLYHLLTGRTSQKNKSFTDIQAMLLKGEFDPPRQVNPSIPKPLEAICLRAMQRQPADRYPSMSSLALDIKHWLADEPVSAHSESLVERSSRAMRRHKSWAVAIASSLLVIAVISVGSAGWVNQARLAERSANEKTKLALVAETDANQRASARFDLAMNAVSNFYQGTSRDVLLKEPELTELRAGLLEMALEFYRQLADELATASSPKEQSLLADAYLGLARVTNEVGANEDAITGCRQALEIYERLSRKAPEIDTYQFGLASSRFLLAQFLTKSDLIPEAMKTHQRAIEGWERLANRNPDNEVYPSRLANNLLEFGLLLQATGETENAEDQFERAIQIFKNQVKEFSGIAEYQNALSVAYSNLGSLRREMGDSQSARAFFQDAIDIHEALIEHDSNNQSALKGLASSYSNLGVLERDSGNLNRARNHFQNANLANAQLTEFNPAIADYQHRLAMSSTHLGSFEFDTGQPDEARLAYQDAIEIEEKLVEVHPTVGKYADSLATGLLGLGQVETAVGNTSTAIPHLRRSIGVFEELVKQNPLSNDYQRGLVGGLKLLGNALYRNGDLVNAEQAYQQSINVNRKLVERNPEHFLYKDSLAKGLSNLGNVQRRRDNIQAAENSYHESIEISKQLILQNPEVIEPAIGLGASFCNLGNLLRSRQQFDEALKKYEQALEILRPVLEKDQTLASARAFTRSTLVARAKTYDLLKRYHMAADDWNQARLLSEGNQQLAFLRFEAFSLARAKSHSEASDKARELAETKITQLMFDAACVYSLCASAAAPDETATPPDNNELSNAYCSLAMDLLNQLKDAGHFEAASEFDQLKSNPDLDFIRRRDGFKGIVDAAGDRH